MELVPYAEIDSLPRRLWKRVYTSEEKLARSKKYKQYAELRKQSYLPTPPKQIRSSNELRAKQYAKAAELAAGPAALKCRNGQDRQKIEAIYLLAIEKSCEGIKQSVDHIYPISGEKYGVCGLHVPANLVVMPLIENMKKNNRPHESWIDYVGF